MSDEHIIADWDGFKKHKKSIYFRKHGLNKLVTDMDDFAAKLSEVKGTRIALDETRLGECHYRASHSLKYHKLKNCSVYKEMAHLAFWIAKLKPLRFISPMEPVQDFVSVGFKKAFGGEFNKIENKAKKLDEKYLDVVGFPLNEAIAVTLLLDMVESSQHAQLSELEDHVERSNLLSFITSNQKKRLWLHHKLRVSLRDHNYSIRGLAVSVESTLKPPHEAESDFERELERLAE